MQLAEAVLQGRKIRRGVLRENGHANREIMDELRKFGRSCFRRCQNAFSELAEGKEQL